MNDRLFVKDISDETSNNKSFLFIAPGDLEKTKLIDTASLNITTKLQKTLKSILSCQDLLDHQSTVSYEVLAQSLNMNIRTLQLAIRKLRNHGILINKRFRFSNSLKVAGRGLSFDEFDFNQIDMLKKVDEDAFIKQRQKAASERHASQRLLKEQKLQTKSEARIRKNTDLNSLSVKLPVGSFLPAQLTSKQVRPRGAKARTLAEKQIFAKESREILVKNNNNQIVKCIVESRSYSGLMDPSDLQVLLAIYTLINRYHSARLDDYFESEDKPAALTPVYVDDIVLLIGRSLGGPNRDYVRDCIGSINDTEYDMSLLDSIGLNSDFKELYVSQGNEFKNFKRCIALSEAKPELVNGRRVLGKSSIYMIELPDRLFDALMSQKFLLSFPVALLSLPPILFTLYMRFRAKCKRGKSGKLRLDEYLRHTYDDIGSNRESFSAFKANLIRALKRISLSKENHLSSYLDTVEEEFCFNLFGYHGKLSVKENFYSVTCHEQEMLSCCNSDIIDNGKKKAPIVFNELSSLYRDQISTVAKKHIMAISSTNKRRFDIQYTLINNEVISIHKFVTESEIENFAQIMVKASNSDHEYHLIIETIVNDLSQIEGLCLSLESDNKLAITRDIYDELLVMFNFNYEYLDHVSFCNRINRKSSFHQDIYDCVIDGKEPSISLLKFMDTLQVLEKQ